MLQQQRIQSSHCGVRKKSEEEEEHTRVDRHHPLPPVVVAVVAYPCLLLLLVSSGAAADAFPFPPSASPLTNLSLSSLGRSSLSKKTRKSRTLFCVALFPLGFWFGAHLYPPFSSSFPEEAVSCPGLWLLSCLPSRRRRYCAGGFKRSMMWRSSTRLTGVLKSTATASTGKEQEGCLRWGELELHKV